MQKEMAGFKAGVCSKMGDKMQRDQLVISPKVNNKMEDQVQKVKQFYFRDLIIFS